MSNDSANCQNGEGAFWYEHAPWFTAPLEGAIIRLDGDFGDGD
jgi:hypothetical protein